MRWPWLLGCVLCLSAQDSRFDVRSRLVLAPVTVIDAHGRTIDDLESPDFVVLDNGRERKVAVDTIATGVAPIALIVAVQSSGISAAVLEKVRRIGPMVQPLVIGERGCAGLLSFAESVTWLQDCASDADAFGRALDRIRPGDHKAARMVDAVEAAVGHLKERPHTRRVLLLISESRDRGSEAELEAAMLTAQSAGVTIYAATYSALTTAFTSKAKISEPGRTMKPKNPAEEMGTFNGAPPSKYNAKNVPREQRTDVLAGIGELARLGKTNTSEALAVATGGTTFPFTRQKGLETAIEKLGAELHTQYVLSFAPDKAEPGYHHLEVRITRKGEFHIRARPGYWAPE